MKNLRQKYREWCVLTKRKGEILIGSCIIEFLEWAQTPPKVPKNDKDPDVVRRKIISKLTSKESCMEAVKKVSEDYSKWVEDNNPPAFDIFIKNYDI